MLQLLGKIARYGLVMLSVSACADVTTGAPLAVEPVPAPAPTTQGRPAFCDREGANAIREVFCAETKPEIRSLHDLQALLQLEPDLPPADLAASFSVEALGVARGVVVTGHSTALSGRLVSPINPRAITMGGNHTIMAYQRGVQQVEIVTAAKGTTTFDFYLLRFRQACSDAAHGCSPGDLYTPRIESDWTSTEIHDAEDLKNTPLDCRQCHQRGRDTPRLLMRELESPWTHFFEPIAQADTTSGGSPLPGARGVDLVYDYLKAKGDEPYAGIPVRTITATTAFTLQGVVGADQPLLFDAPNIENERYPYGPAGRALGVHPSPTWDSAYDAFKRGEQLALPYIEPRATDPAKQAQLTAAYASFRAGEISADALPDMADIFPDDPHVRAQIGLQTEPDATPTDALIQACGSCHNDVLDQTISRALFNIDVSRLERGELDRAIERIERPRTAAGAMPPPEARQLDPAVKARLLAHLRSANVSTADAQLQHAAQVGMVGGHAVQ